MKILPAKAKDEKTFTGRYSRGLWNQNGEHLVNLCESNILETQVIQPERYFLLKVSPG